MREKQTKIVATISDRKCDVDFLKELYQAGTNVVRVNTAHQQPEDTLKIIQNVRQVADDLAVLIDTKGPEIRTSPTDGEVTLEEGSQILVRSDEYHIHTNSEVIRVSYTHFVAEVNIGDKILLDDGVIGLEVKEKHDDQLVCSVINSGTFEGRKSVNVPGVSMKLDALTEKDERYVRFAAEQDVEFIAHSFVRTKEDVLGIQRILDDLKSKVKIIAKIENQEGVDNIDEILPHVYGVMVARGDLGVELPAEEIPIIQKMLVKKCNQFAKPVIVATQMLQSMIDHPKPTRAEVTDIATAVYDGTDAVMLSGETAYGKYPVEAVKTMSRVAKTVEATLSPNVKDHRVKWNDDVMKYICKKAIWASIDLPVQAIICATRSGATARIVAAYRPTSPVYAKCFTGRVVRELQLSFGVKSSLVEPQESTDALVHIALQQIVENKELELNDLIVILGATPGMKEGIDLLEIKKVEQGLR